MKKNETKESNVSSMSLREWFCKGIQQKFRYTSWVLNNPQSLAKHIADSMEIEPNAVHHAFTDNEHSKVTINFADTSLEFNLTWSNSSKFPEKVVLQDVD